MLLAYLVGALTCKWARYCARRNLWKSLIDVLVNYRWRIVQLRQSPAHRRGYTVHACHGCRANPIRADASALLQRGWTHWLRFRWLRHFSSCLDPRTLAWGGRCVHSSGIFRLRAGHIRRAAPYEAVFGPGALLPQDTSELFREFVAACRGMAGCEGTNWFVYSRPRLRRYCFKRFEHNFCVILFQTVWAPTGSSEPEKFV